MTKISVTIATKNEENNIERCLESVKWADEIVIVDDVSTDKTLDICKKYTQKIFINDSNGNFHINKNLAIEKALGEWILSLDADEVISDELRKEIENSIAADDGKIAGYYIPRLNHFLGKSIYGCGWYPDYIIRLFRKGITNWPLNIHDTPQIKDKSRIGYLKNPIIHYSYTSISQYFEKFNRYTTKLAKEEYEKGVRLNGRNILFYIIVKPIYWFIRKYIFLGGFRDGIEGFFISFSSGLTVFTTYIKLWEMLKNEKK